MRDQGAPRARRVPVVAEHGIIGLSLSLRFEGVDLGVKVRAVCPAT